MVLADFFQDIFMKTYSSCMHIVFDLFAFEERKMYVVFGSKLGLEIAEH